MFEKINKITSKFTFKYNENKINKKPRRRYLASIYSGLAIIKSAYESYEKVQVKKTRYDPYQVEQLSELYQYNPFHKEIQSNITTDNITTKDDNELILVDDESETVIVHSELSQSTAQPVAKRLRTMATNAAENAVHTFIYGAMITFDFVWSEKKSIQEFVQEKSIDLAHQIIPTPQPPKMRGFGVDFCPDVDNSPSIQFKIDRKKYEQKEPSIQHNFPNATSAGYYGLSLKRSHDENDWGMVEKADYSVRFKF